MFRAFEYGIILNGKLQIQITQYFLSYKPFYFKIKHFAIYDLVTHTKFTSRKKKLPCRFYK